MQLISDEKINEIRNSADIVTIIAGYIPLTMKGKNFFGVCPFHDDHSPSMSVSKERQLFKCFVCNKGGNVFTFVKDYENISYVEAVKKVADKVGIPLELNNVKKIVKKEKQEYEIMEFATKIYQNNLNSKEGTLAKEYLKKRNITDEIIKDFRIGLALDNSTYLYNILTKKYDLVMLDNLGLINKSGLSGYDKFINRIMIPISDADGFVVGYTGRIYDNSDQAKYINTKETIIYKKGHILFNFHNAKKYVRDAGSLIVVEGNMDAIRLYASGIKNVIALMGTTITKEQIEIIKKLRIPVILMLDNDSAGEMATLNISKELNKNGIDVKVVRLSNAKDPDEYIVKYGVNSIKDAINHCLNFYEYTMNTLKGNKNLEESDDLINYVKDVLKTIENSDALTKEITIKKLSKDYDIDYKVLKDEINLTNDNPLEPKKNIAILSDTRYNKCVKNLLYYMMSDKNYVKIYNKQLGFLKNVEERNLVREIEYYIDKFGNINLADFLSYAESNDRIREYVHNICSGVSFDELSIDVFMDYIKMIDNIMIDENIVLIKKKLSMSSDINEKLELTKQLTGLVKKRSGNNGRN